MTVCCCMGMKIILCTTIYYNLYWFLICEPQESELSITCLNFWFLLEFLITSVRWMSSEVHSLWRKNAKLIISNVTHNPMASACFDTRTWHLCRHEDVVHEVTNTRGFRYFVCWVDGTFDHTKWEKLCMLPGSLIASKDVGGLSISNPAWSGWRDARCASNNIYSETHRGCIDLTLASKQNSVVHHLSYEGHLMVMGSFLRADRLLKGLFAENSFTCHFHLQHTPKAAACVRSCAALHNRHCVDL